MKTRILCYGDSNTFGYIPAGNSGRYPSSVRWTGRLQKLLGEDYLIIEEGCSGRTTDVDPAGEPFKNGRAFLKAALSSHKPLDLVIIMLGTNDLKSVFQRSPEDIAGSLTEMINDTRSYLSEKQGYIPEILILSPASLHESASEGVFGNSFDALSVRKSKLLASYYEKAAQKAHVMFCNIDKFTAVSELDGVHLTEESHAALAEYLSRLIKEAGIPCRNTD